MENQNISQNDEFLINNLWNKYIKYWPWFVLSVLLCCGLAVVYIKSTSKTYKRTATVLVREDNRQDITAAFSNDHRQWGEKNVNVNNEIEAFKSPELIQEVVQRLKLNIGYVMKDGLKQVDLYAQSPVIAEFPNSREGESFSFQIELLPDSVVVLSNFVQKTSTNRKVEIKQDIKTKFNEETSTPIGNVIISPSLYYSSGQFQVPVVVTKGSVKNVALWYAKYLTVSLSSKQNTIIVLDMEDVSIQRAEDFLNTLMSVYNESSLAEKNRETKSTLEFLNERIPLIEQELKTIDDRLAQYKSTYKVTDTRVAGSMDMSQSREYSSKALEVNTQINIAGFIRDHLAKNSKTAEMIPELGLKNPAIESYISQYNAKLFDRNKLITNGGENNPAIVTLNSELQSLRQSLIHTVDNLITTLNMQMSDFRSQEDRMTSRIASNPVQEKQLLSIEREQNLKADLLLYLLQKRSENEMALTVNTTNSRVISRPSGGMSPVKPNKYIALLIAFFVGVGVPGGVIWGRDSINTSIRDKKDVESLPVPLLGVIPESKKRGMLLVRDDGKDAVNEAFRILRTNLGLIGMKDAKVIHFTSLESGTGKTFMALNLAMTFAVAGKRVILLDLDLRRATLSRMTGCKPIGISQLLEQQLNEDLFIENNYIHAGFDILPAGDKPSKPSELLMSEHLKLLIAKLKAKYDYVFLDSTPANILADATITAQLADLSIFVVREKFTDRRKIAEIKNLYRGGKFRNMHIVLNGSVTENTSDKYHEYDDKNSKNVPLIPKASFHELKMSEFLLHDKNHEENDG
ncbi:MAG: polysaccharide biosynthesis tyrosine autokinase [Bacteroidales bacterium]|jgi:capsular exopolysaccharide synthesis family protein|nr:polysaccharide biosynthesis tyrosine autokinase [Bacteroidales bacterium]